MEIKELNGVLYYSGIGLPDNNVGPEVESVFFYINEETQKKYVWTINRISGVGNWVELGDTLKFIIFDELPEPSEEYSTTIALVLNPESQESEDEYDEYACVYNNELSIWEWEKLNSHVRFWSNYYYDADGNLILSKQNGDEITSLTIGDPNESGVNVNIVGDTLTFNGSKIMLWEKTEDGGYVLDKDATNSSADGALGVAYGNSTHANGNSSHAEGTSTEANGSSSHAEGQLSIASGDSSHAEGKSTIAYGYASHVEGQENKAWKWASHAEGHNTVADGNCAHAEGNNTTANNSYAHAEGSLSIAYGNASHAEGDGDCVNKTYQLPGTYSWEEGSYNITASTLDGIYEGLYISPSDSLDDCRFPNKITWVDYDNNVFSVERAYEIGLSDANLYKIETGALGYASHTEGYGTFATGSQGHAEGTETMASGDSAHSEGKYTKAFKNYTHAEGYLTEAGTDRDYNDINPGENNEGYYSHAEGNATAAKGSASHSEGKQTFADGYAAHAEGNCTETHADAAHAEGLYTVAGYTQKDYTDLGTLDRTGENQLYITSKQYIELVNLGIQDGTQIRLVGYEFLYTINNFTSIEIDDITYASFTLTGGEQPTVGTTNISWYSPDLYTETSFGNHSHAEGCYTVTTNDDEHAEGRYNVSNTDTIHSIGIGNGLYNRKNAVEVMQNGDFYMIGVGGYQGTDTKVQDQSILTVQEVIDGIHQTITDDEEVVSAALNDLKIDINRIESEFDEKLSHCLTDSDGYVISSSINELYDTKQDKLTAGNNITISNDGIISADVPTVGTGNLNIKINQSGTVSPVSGFNANQDSDEDIIFSAGSNVTLSASGNTITISATGGSTVGTLNTTNATSLTPQSSESLSGTIDLHKISKTGSYNDLIGAPTLATVATSGSYNDLSDKPVIPAAQVNADWNASSGISEILNKPTFATVATSGSYNDLSNKPTIPTVGDGSLHIKVDQSGSEIDVIDFNANQDSSDDITFVAGSNITLTPDTTNKTITIAATGGISGIDITVPSDNITYPILLGNTNAAESDVSSIQKSVGLVVNPSKKSVAEGDGTTASGQYSHASGQYTIANIDAQTVVGKYNDESLTDALFVVGNGTNTSRSNAFYVENGGDVYASGAYYAASDKRKKDIIGDINLEKAYSLLETCQTVTYTWKDDESKKQQIGVIAQEIQQFFPEIVNEDEHGMLSVDYSRLTVILMSVIKNNVKEMKSLEERIKLLEEKIR